MMSSISLRERIRSSALWAAYGDALGFPTELASPTLLRQRLGADGVARTQPWKRLVGGRFGVMIELPAGAYSDDTQLRLATSRAIRADGFFDVEAFAKIELPVWQSYALGAGRGTRAAASALANRAVTWYSNFFSTESAVYLHGGGNGAAMRVQPHVWAAKDLANSSTYMPDVVRNAVCTHGNFRGIGGAAIYAVVLAETLRNRKIPGPDQWMDFAGIIDSLPSLIENDSDLSTFWQPTWESNVNAKIENAAEIVADEWARASAAAVQQIVGDPITSYTNIVDVLQGFSSEERGSGIKSALFALSGAYLLQEIGTRDALLVIANVLGSDTDTIATMAGAILGAVDDSFPSDTIQDYAYIDREAIRMFEISCGTSSTNFEYPDLLYWQAPKNAIDAVGKTDIGLAVAGLGPLRECSVGSSQQRNESVWEWGTLEFGQTILYKRRFDVPKLRPQFLSRGYAHSSSAGALPTNGKDRGEGLGSRELTEKSKYKIVKNRASLDALTDDVIQSNFPPELIGSHLLSFADDENALEYASAYAAIIIKAKRARSKRS